MQLAVPATEGGKPQVDQEELSSRRSLLFGLATIFNAIWRRGAAVPRFVALTDDALVLLHATMEGGRKVPGVEIARLARHSVPRRDTTSGMLVIDFGAREVWVRSDVAIPLRDALRSRGSSETR